MPRRSMIGYFADRDLEGEDDDATWTTWKFCTRDRIRKLLHGKPAANPELRALGLVETFSRTYSLPAIKSVIKFARAFNVGSESCAFRGRRINYGKEDLRRIFSLPSGPFSDVRVGWSQQEMKNSLFKKEIQTTRHSLPIKCLKDEFQSWCGPIRLVQELLLGKRQPTQGTKKPMWYFFAHLSGSVEPGKPKPDWAELVLHVLKTEIEKLKFQLKKTPVTYEARAGKQKCPVFCGTALMAILTYHGFSEEELSRDWQDHGTSTRGQRERRRKQGSATNERDVEPDCGGPATVETERKKKRRRISIQVKTSKRRRDLEGDGEQPERAVTRQMAKNRKGSKRTKHDLETTTKVLAMKKILRRYKKRKSSRSEIGAPSGLADTQVQDDKAKLGESIDQKLLRQQEVDSLQEKHEREQGELHAEHMEKMNENTRIHSGLQKALEEVSEYRKELLQSQEELHTKQMAKKVNENARLVARLQKAEEEAMELKKKIFESEVKTRKAYVCSQGWKDSSEGVSKLLEQANAENQNLTLRAGVLSTDAEMARSLKKNLEDENVLLRQQLRRQSAILEENWDSGAPENWNESAPSPRSTSGSVNVSQTREPTVGPSGAAQTVEPKLESLRKA